MFWSIILLPLYFSMIQRHYKVKLLQVFFSACFSIGKMFPFFLIFSENIWLSEQRVWWGSGVRILVSLGVSPIQTKLNFKSYAKNLTNTDLSLQSECRRLVCKYDVSLSQDNGIVVTLHTPLSCSNLCRNRQSFVT